MIEYKLAQLKKLAAHQVGNAHTGDGLFVADNLVDIYEERLQELLRKYFLSHFTTPEFYQFTFSSGEVDMNPLYRFCKRIFEDPNTLLEQSANMAKYLYECATHPNIKGGDFYVAYFENINTAQHSCSAIGLFKAENKEAFIKLINEDDFFGLLHETGINIDKLDKGCLILNTQAEQGYKIAIVDRANRGGEAQYWKDDFLKLKPLADNYFHTQNLLSATKNFVTQQLTEDYELSKADQIDLLNKSVEYFKTNERFKEEEFATSVFGDDEELKDSFNKYKQETLGGDENSLLDDFEISSPAVKKQAKVFKSVLKLDKNFHIYIHGNKELIEKGTDEQGRKFYKIFYT